MPKAKLQETNPSYLVLNSDAPLDLLALMHLQLWKPIYYCAAMILEKKSKPRETASEEEANEKLENKLQQAFEEPRPLGRLRAEREFLRATVHAQRRFLLTGDSIPELDESFSEFLALYPRYKASEEIDCLRQKEYPHLAEPDAKVCLDYCGFGLFSHLQSFQNWESSSLTLSELTGNLRNLALYGSAEAGTAEHDVKTRILSYLNIPENEYGMVFTVSRGSAFKLLAEMYPFQTNKKLLTMLDHESQSVSWMAQSARDKGAKVYNAWFRWPTLKLCSGELRKQLSSGKKRRKKDSATGLFVFPVQSRVTGAKYSYQWMAMAQQNHWHVLLDAGALGPKDMDSLGLSLFRPDFVITSFYRVFGEDPTGFGCLLIKKSVMQKLQSKNGGTGTGMVTIVPVFPQYLGDSLDGLGGIVIPEGEEVFVGNEDVSAKTDAKHESQLPAFSGVFTSAQVQNVFETEMDQDSSSAREETESVSVGEVMKSPCFSQEDELSENSMWIELGQSPLQSEISGPLNKEDGGSPLPQALSNGRRKHHRQKSRRIAAKMVNNPTYDDHLFSFDAVLLSMSQELAQVKKEPEEASLQCNGNNASEIEEESEVTEVAGSCVAQSTFANGLEGPEHHNCEENGSTTEICSKNVTEIKKSAIKRETEGEFRLMGRSEASTGRYNGGRFFGIEENGQIAGMSRRVSFTLEETKPMQRLSSNLDSAKVFEQTHYDDNANSDGDAEDAEEWSRKEPEIICRHLDHVNKMGLSKTTSRLRYLVNWLAFSLLQLHLRDPNGGDSLPLVQIYGPKVKYERGAAVAFNVNNSNGTLISPEIVQKLAEKEGISLGISFLSHIRIMEDGKRMPGTVELADTPWCRPIKSGHEERTHATIRVEVVTASLGFLTNFKDVYRMWAFVAKFLDPAFVEASRVSSVLEVSDT